MQPGSPANDACSHVSNDARAAASIAPALTAGSHGSVVQHA